MGFLKYLIQIRAASLQVMNFQSFKTNGIKVNMDGVGGALDNVYIEIVMHKELLKKNLS